jgi:hypothetical protein
MELATGIEPATCGLQNSSSIEEDSNSNAPPNKETDDLEQNSDKLVNCLELREAARKRLHLRFHSHVIRNILAASLSQSTFPLLKGREHV